MSKEYYDKWRSEHREEAKAYAKEYRKSPVNAQRHKEVCKQYQQKNKKQLREKANERRRKRMKEDKAFHLLHNMRRRLGLVMKGKRKAEATRILVGCSFEELKNYLESKFKDGMTWNNYGSYWHVDHIIPCKSFNLEIVEHQKKCFHYTNLQPLSAKENIVKGAKIL